VYAFNAQTGAQVWRQTAQSAEDAPYYLASNAVANGIVCVPNLNGLKAYRASDGQQIWALLPPQGNISLPEIVGDSVVYISSDDHLHGARLSDGAALWETPVFGTGRAEEMLGGFIYTVSGDATLTVLDAATGKVVGSYDLATSIIDGLVVGA
jgi:outer membrane protein assembly factor BamB